MELILVRHTTPLIGKGICYGQTNLELMATAKEELQNTRNLIEDDLSKAIVVSSPLRRCVLLAEFLQKDFEVDERLLELNFGEWENKPWNSLDQEALQYWMQNFIEQSPPGGESLTDLYNRVEDFWQKAKEDNPSKLIVVTHSGVIRCFLKMALNFPLDNLFVLPLTYGGVTRIHYQPGRGFTKVLSFNHTSG